MEDERGGGAPETPFHLFMAMLAFRPERAEHNSPPTSGHRSGLSIGANVAKSARPIPPRVCVCAAPHKHLYRLA
jgi:hypothetical protein